jgi:nucleotide-binding universal stress UspA family protein
MVGTDGSDAATRAAKYAVASAKARQAKLVIACVIDWSPYDLLTPDELEKRSAAKQKEIDQAQAKIIAPLLASLESEGVTIDTVIRHGHPTRTLEKLAHELGIEQIFVGRHGQSRIERALFGSVASNLVQIASVPVTVVP